MNIPTPASTVIVVPREAHTPWPGMLETLVANTELHDHAFYLPRWSDECARTSFAHFNERRELRAIDKVATPVALATSNRARARCEPARLVQRATWSEA